VKLRKKGLELELEKKLEMGLELELGSVLLVIKEN
jgi:hypothetical protein